MKVMKVNNSYPQINQQQSQQFKGKFMQKAGRGLIPMVLAGGMLMAQSAKAGDTSNFYPENEISIPHGDKPLKFLGGMILGAVVFYGILGIMNWISSDNKENENKE